MSGCGWEQTVNSHTTATRSPGSRMAIAPARLVEWPLRCGPVPPLADCHSPRPETGLGRIGKLDPGRHVNSRPAPDAGPADRTAPNSGTRRRAERAGQRTASRRAPAAGSADLAASGDPASLPPPARPPGGYLGRLRRRRWPPAHLAASRRPPALCDLAASGGTGKTQLAAALAHQLWDSRAVDLLVWVKASSRNAILTGYALTLAELGAADPGDDLLTGAQRFLAWLSRTERRWLVVLDDLADPADLDGLWPAGTDGRVVVTARRDGTLAAPNRRIAPVPAFSTREALAYLTRAARHRPWPADRGPGPGRTTWTASRSRWRTPQPR